MNAKMHLQTNLTRPILERRSLESDQYNARMFALQSEIHADIAASQKSPNKFDRMDDWKQDGFHTVTSA